MIIDLHCHSIYSDDSLLTIENIALLSKNKGIDGICITDHESFVDQHLLDEIILISRKVNIKIFIGAEINRDIGHIITFGINEYKFGMHRIEFLYDEVIKNKGALIWAHPYRRVINENEKMTKLKNFNPMALREKYSVGSLKNKNNYSSFCGSGTTPSTALPSTYP